MRVKETIERNIVIEGKTYVVTVEHDGITPFAEQVNGLSELDSFLSDELKKPDEKRTYFVPFNNFECSLKWGIKFYF